MLRQADREGCHAPVAPRYRNDLRLSEVDWAESLSGRDKRTTLRLRCLPRKLCTLEAVQAELTKAGLDEMVDLVRVFPSQRNQFGSALLNAVNSEAVVAVGRYFHGRQWGRSLPVAVSFAAIQGVHEVQKMFPVSHSSSTGTCGLWAMKAEPWHINTKAAGDLSTNSEVSTEVGDDAESWANDAGGEASKRLLEPMTVPLPAMGGVRP